MNGPKIIIALTIIVAAVSSAAGQKPQHSGSASEGEPNASQIVRIKLPDYAGEVPKGPNMQVYESNCLLCHGARYVTIQPPFSRETWQKEVKKMVDAYGAKIPEADQSKIVDYLVAVRGVAESKPGQSSH
jgi:cytochrome c5